jgi:quercetin dioxygenase-like cupin family protein
MSRRTLASLIVAVLAAGGFIACSEEEAPTAPRAPLATHDMGSDVAAVTLEPFTFRAPLAPFQIHQLPDFKIHSNATKDIVIQRAVFLSGAGPWHTHPGPSFVYVIEGQIKVDRVTNDGCTETPVHVPGDAYFEVADEVHRAVVTSVQPAVLMVTRFNIPVGQPFTIMAADPGC